ncbi:MAG: hypothetical protein ACLT76_03100 [Clostridium fessum]
MALGHLFQYYQALERVQKFEASVHSIWVRAGYDGRISSCRCPFCETATWHCASSAFIMFPAAFANGKSSVVDGQKHDKYYFGSVMILVLGAEMTGAYFTLSSVFAYTRWPYYLRGKIDTVDSFHDCKMGDKSLSSVAGSIFSTSK